MKKLLFCTFLLVCISAFAFKPNLCSTVNTNFIKEEKVTPKQSPDPITDMVMFPHLGM